MELKRENPLKGAFRKLLNNKLATACFIILLIEILLVVLAPLIAPYDPEAQDVYVKLAPGFWGMNNTTGVPYAPGHWLGTDNLGRDIFSRLLWGGRITLTVGFVSTMTGLFFGVLFGLLAGFYKKLDNIIMRFIDVYKRQLLLRCLFRNTNASIYWFVSNFLLFMILHFLSPN